MTAEDILLAIVKALEEAAIPYMVVGALASNYYGIQRSTQDADFLLQVQQVPVSRLSQLLGPEFRVDPQISIETITLGPYYVVHHPASDFHIDLFLLRDDSYDVANFGRRIRVSYGSGETYMPTAEDVIVSKLRWSLSGRRNKDVDDARNVLAVQQGRLDMGYIRHWCGQHGTLALLEQTLESIPPLPDAL